MTTSPSPMIRGRNRLLAAAASVAIASAIGFGAMTSGTAPVLAEAVRVDAPQAPRDGGRCVVDDAAQRE